MKLKIENNTELYTSDLRRIFRKCMEQEGVNFCTAIIHPTNSQYIHGKAYLNGTRVWMYLPEGTPKRIDELAQVFIHELHHCLGLKHREMIKLQLIDVSAVAGFKVRKQQRKELVKPEKGLQQKRYEKAMRMRNKYQEELKRKEALLKKWDKKVKYYERVMK